MKDSKIFRSIIFLAPLFLCGGLHAQSKIKLGCVDMQSALNEVEEGKRAKATIEVLAKQKSDSLAKKREELRKMKEELESKKSVMSEDARKKKEEGYNRLVLEYQQAEYITFQELKARESELTGDILKRLSDIVEEIGKKEGYSMVIEKGSLLYDTEDCNLTEKVIKLYNERRK